MNEFELHFLILEFNFKMILFHLAKISINFFLFFLLFSKRFLEATNEREEEQINAGDLQQSTSYRFKQKDIVSSNCLTYYE